jgi:hypothetical protein
VEVRGLPQARARGKPAVRMARRDAREREGGVGEARVRRLPVSEDSDHGRQRGVAGPVGRMEANRARSLAGMERQGPGGHGGAGAGVGKDAT